MNIEKVREIPNRLIDRLRREYGNNIKIMCYTQGKGVEVI